MMLANEIEEISIVKGCLTQLWFQSQSMLHWLGMTRQDSEVELWREPQGKLSAYSRRTSSWPGNAIFEPWIDQPNSSKRVYQRSSCILELLPEVNKLAGDPSSNRPISILHEHFSQVPVHSLYNEQKGYPYNVSCLKDRLDDVELLSWGVKLIDIL